MPLPDWLNSFPEWLPRLAVDPAAAELGLVWLSEAQGLEQAQRIATTYDGEGSPLVPLPEQMLATARNMLSDKIVVAIGPKMSMRVSEEGIESLLIIDRSRPDELLIALSRDYPPFLWIPAGTTIASIRAVLSGYFPKEDPPRARLHRIARYFVGNERMLDTDIHGIENHYVSSPFTAELTWGSATSDDPWPTRVEGAVPVGNFMHDVLRNSKQDDDSVYTTSFRLQHSRGILTVEDHNGLFVFEVRYLPSPHREVVVGVNRRFELAFPSDMPVDGVAALLGLSLQTEAMLKDTLADHELAEDHDLVLHALAALKSGDLSVGTDFTPFLRPHTKVETKPGSLRAATIPPPPSVRNAAFILTQQLDMDFVVLKHAAVKSDLDALDHLDRALGQGPRDGWEGQHGPHLLIASDVVARQSIDWVWGDQGWVLTREVARGPKRLFQRYWQTRDGRSTVGYVEDHRSGFASSLWREKAATPPSRTSAPRSRSKTPSPSWSLLRARLTPAFVSERSSRSLGSRRRQRTRAGRRCSRPASRTRTPPFARRLCSAARMSAGRSSLRCSRRAPSIRPRRSPGSITAAVKRSSGLALPHSRRSPASDRQMRGGICKPLLFVPAGADCGTISILAKGFDLRLVSFNATVFALTFHEARGNANEGAPRGVDPNVQVLHCL